MQFDIETPADRFASPMRWSLTSLWRAPHRLSFFAGMVVLLASGLWWLLVQLDRVTGQLGIAYAIAPTLTHSAVMTMGFMPLFFAGFLFTAGPKWLGMPAPSAGDIAPSLALQVLGWLVWLAGAHAHAYVAAGGAMLAALGLRGQYVRFVRLLLRSSNADKVHASVVAAGGLVGTLCTAGISVAVWVGADSVASTLVHSALWGCVTVTYGVVAHRMIPFFTAAALPSVKAWRPMWILVLLVGVGLLEFLAAWVSLAGFDGAPIWRGLRGTLELTAGGALVWLAWVWGLASSLKVRLLAMLHIGFLWLGVGMIMLGASQWLALMGGSGAYMLGALHAVTIGYLGSLLLAMVTRVSCGHSGRPLQADALAWGSFCLLQVAAVVRLLQAGMGALSSPALLLVAGLWLLIMLVWGGRLLSWYGRPRVDGKPG